MLKCKLSIKGKCKGNFSPLKCDGLDVPEECKEMLKSNTRQCLNADNFAVETMKGCGKTFTYLKNKNGEITMECGTSHKGIVYLCDDCSLNAHKMSNSGENK